MRVLVYDNVPPVSGATSVLLVVNPLHTTPPRLILDFLGTAQHVHTGCVIREDDPVVCGVEDIGYVNSISITVLDVMADGQPLAGG